MIRAIEDDELAMGDEDFYTLQQATRALAEKIVLPPSPKYAPRLELSIRNDVIIVWIDGKETFKQISDHFPSEDLVAKIRLMLL